MWEVAGILAVASVASAHNLGDRWSCHHCRHRLHHSQVVGGGDNDDDDDDGSGGHYGGDGGVRRVLSGEGIQF